MERGGYGGVGGYFLVCYLRESAQARVVRALNNDLRHDLCCQLLQKGYQDYHKQDSGEYLSWMTNDIKQIEQLAWNPFFNCVGRASQVLWGHCGAAEPALVADGSFACLGAHHVGAAKAV